MKKTCVAYLILLLPCFGFSQTQGQALIDSLLAQLPGAADDASRVKLLDDISYEYCYTNPDEGIKYGQQALKLAESIEWPFGIASAYASLGSNYVNKSDFVEVLNCEYKAL